MPKRPFLVTMLAVSVLILTAYNAVRLGTALAQWDLLAAWVPNPGPTYIAATGLFWTLGLLGVALSLWLGPKWARPTGALAIFLYMSYYWLDRLLFSAQSRQNGLFVLGATIMYGFFVALALNLPGSRKFFTDKRE